SGDADLAVALCGVRIADREQRAVHFDRQVQRRARGELADVHVAANAPRRNRAVLTRLRHRHAHNATKGRERYVDAWHAAAARAVLEVPDLEEVVGKVFWQKSAPRPECGPAPRGWPNLLDLDD